MSIRRFLSIAAASLLAAGVAGCATDSSQARQLPTYEQAASSSLIPANYAAATALLAQVQHKLDADRPILMATLVNIDALDRSSTLGRLTSEHVSARFALAGYRMVEMKFRNNVYMARDQGEMMLTREIRDIATSHNAQAVIVGTYAESSEFVFLNVKVIQPQTNLVLAVHDYVLPLDNVTKPMLRASR